MFYLLDINVLIAASDLASEFQPRFLRWLQLRRSPALATCPISENGFLRIYGHPDYPGGPGSPVRALIPLQVLRQRPGYRFVPDDASLADAASGLALARVTPKRLTDFYLLALAVRHGGRFATFDEGVSPDGVPGGAAALDLIRPA